MIIKEKIRKLVGQHRDEAYANACQIWRGYGEMGQEPYGWWLKPFNQNARWLGANWIEVKEYW